MSKANAGYGGNDPERAAYDFAWEGFQEAEYEALALFGAATAYLEANPEETGEGDETVSIVDGNRIATQESVTTYELVDISVAVRGLRLAVGLAQLATITTTTPVKGGTPAMEVVVQNRAEVVDTSFEPPIPTGEEYIRPPVTLRMSEDGEDIADKHFTSPERPASYDILLAARADQERYAGLLENVLYARRLRGEIPA